MKTLYIERSTGECRNGDWVEQLDLAERPERIVVGTGPGSFAGIRSALAFAQGYALGAGKAPAARENGKAADAAGKWESYCEVLGLPSACALVDGGKVAVVGDARRGKAWVALFDGFNLVKDIFQVEQTELAKSVPTDYVVTTPDAARIDALLRETFGERYRGGAQPTAEGLKRFSEANPSILKPEPLPIYLNPAVRD